MPEMTEPLLSADRISQLASQAVDDGFEHADGDYDAGMSTYPVEQAIRQAIRETAEAVLLKVAEPDAEISAAFWSVGVTPEKLMELVPLAGTGQGDLQMVPHHLNISTIMRLDERLANVASAIRRAVLREQEE